MLRNSLIAISAAAALVMAIAPAAEAKTNIDFNLNFGVGGGYAVFGAPGYYGPGYIYADDGCRYVKVKHKKVKANGKLKVWYTKQLVCY